MFRPGSIPKTRIAQFSCEKPFTSTKTSLFVQYVIVRNYRHTEPIQLSPWACRRAETRTPNHRHPERTESQVIMGVEGSKADTQLSPEIGFVSSYFTFKILGLVVNLIAPLVLSDWRADRYDRVRGRGAIRSGAIPVPYYRRVSSVNWRFRWIDRAGRGNRNHRIL